MNHAKNGTVETSIEIVYTVEVYLDLINEFDFSQTSIFDQKRPLKSFFDGLTLLRQSMLFVEFL